MVNVVLRTELGAISENEDEDDELFEIRSLSRVPCIGEKIAVYTGVQSHLYEVTDVTWTDWRNKSFKENQVEAAVGLKYIASKDIV